MSLMFVRFGCLFRLGKIGEMGVKSVVWYLFLCLRWLSELFLRLVFVRRQSCFPRVTFKSNAILNARELNLLCIRW